MKYYDSLYFGEPAGAKPEIPEDVKRKIKDTAELRFPQLHITQNAPKNSRRNQARFIEGAEFGYYLAAEEISDLEQTIQDYDAKLIEAGREIERLKHQLEAMQNPF